MQNSPFDSQDQGSGAPWLPWQSEEMFPHSEQILNREDIQTKKPLLPRAIKEQEPPVHPAGATLCTQHRQTAICTKKSICNRD